MGILKSPKKLNPCNDYELDLRENQIVFIDDLEMTEDQYESIDLSNNFIFILDDILCLRRLRVLFLNNNRIMRFGLNLPSFFPNLEMLILTRNKIQSLREIVRLRSLENLRSLTLIENPICDIIPYRLLTIYWCKSLKWLDYAIVKQDEHIKAQFLFRDK